MRSLKTTAIAVMMVASMAIPALGAVIINSANTGTSFTVDYVGQVGGNTTPQVSALGTFTFNSVSNGGLTYNFSYSFVNDSTVTSRLSGFAFNTSPNPTGATVTGAFNSAYATGGNYPEGYGSVDVCFTDGGGSCAGGGSGGFYNGPTPGVGTFALTFAQVMASVSFDNFVTRFQSINGVPGGSSGIGIGSLVQSGGGQPITAPEPGTWLMMLGGFGLVGFAMRSRKRRALSPQIA